MATIEIRDVLDNETGQTIFPRTHVNAVIGLRDTSFFEAVQDTQDPTKYSVKLKPEYTGLWMDGWLAAGGVGSDSGGGGGGLIQSVLSVSDLGTPIPTENLSETFSAKAIESIYESLGGFAVSLSLSKNASYFKDANGNYFLDSNGNRIIVSGAGSSSLSLLNLSGQVLSSVELDIDLSGYATESWVTGRGYITSSALAGYATQSWVQSQGYLTQHQSLANYVTLDGTQTITGAKTFTPIITAGGGIVTAGDIYPSSDGGASLGYGSRRFSNGNIHTIGTSTVYLKDSSSGNSGMLSASGGWVMMRAGADVTTQGSYKQLNFHETYGFYPNESGVNLGYTGSSNRWANIYGVNADLTGELSLASTSHIDIGPLRIEYNPSTMALHITKKDANDTNEYGFYADGFSASGGIEEPSE